MVTLELAEEFLLRGWKVDVYANMVDAPFSHEFARLNSADLFVSDDPGRFGQHQYDLVWVQHSTVPHSALSQILESGEMPRVIWNHMSGFAEMEMPVLADLESRIATLITFVSPEAKDALLPFGLSPEKSRLLQNPAPRSFSAVTPAAPSPQLSSVLFVSNHPPKELEDAAQILQTRGIIVSRVGVERPQRMTPAVLQDVDAVITIGKTTQYALSMGVSVYQYDHFGGCGWITAENVSHEAETNFSGRGTRRILDGATIAQQLTEGFGAASSFSAANINEHRAQFSLEQRLDVLLAEVMRLSPSEINAADLRRWEAMSNIVRKLYRELIGESLHLRDHIAIIGDLRDQLSQHTADAAELSHVLAQERERVSSLENSSSLRLGRALLSPIQRVRSWRKNSR